jgi:hypothetical protein
MMLVQQPRSCLRCRWSSTSNQGIYIIFSAMLLAAVLITIALLRQMKLFQGVKLGEAI